jgi:chromosome segregation ATPase
MSKKRKITRALVCAGLALSVFAGGSAVIASANSKNASAKETTSLNAKQPDGSTPFDFGGKQPPDMRQAKGCMPFGGFDGRQQLSEEQIAALETYAELSKEVNQRYREQYAALLRAYEAEIEEVYASVLGEPYAELKAEYDGLCNQYQGLVNGFYVSEEYVALKTELNALTASLAGLDKKSAEYKAIMDEINIVWGKISVLAGEVNSQISLIRLRVAEISSEIKALMKQNKDALNELISPIAEQFNIDAQTIQSSLMLELEILRQTLGI